MPNLLPLSTQDQNFQLIQNNSGISQGHFFLALTKQESERGEAAEITRSCMSTQQLHQV